MNTQTPETWNSEAAHEAMNQALWSVGALALEAPRACDFAVRELVGVNCWGANLFDQAPLMRVYMKAVGRLSELGCNDPMRELDAMLAGCVAHAQELKGAAFVTNVQAINPVEYLAGSLSHAFEAFLIDYQKRGGKP